MKSLSIILFSVLALTSCEKELDFDYHKVEAQLVIEATLTDKGAQVILTNTTPMNEPTNNVPITDAQVLLTDKNDNRTIVLTPDSNGIFSNDTPGIIGHEYEIYISQEGKEYMSTCLMREASDIVDCKFQWIKMPYDYVAMLQVSFTASNNDDDCYWIKLTRNGEAYMWQTTSNIYAVDSIINHVTMTSRQDIEEEDEQTVLVDGDVVGITVIPISRDMFDYLNSLAQDSNGMKMFIGDFCLGYFFAAQITEYSIVFHPDEISEYVGE